MKRFQQIISMNKQRGAALIILVMILILTVMLLMMGKKSRNADKLQQQANVNKILQDAKDIMIAIAISHPTPPGVLPYPDRAGGGGFNGRGDCSNPTAALPLNPNLLLGRFPYWDQQGGGNCTQIRIAHDVSNSPYPLHYTVSANLVGYNNGTTTNTINTNVILDPDLPSGWLTVFDSNGNTLSNQVAFIIFYPGAPLAGQNRAPTLANAAQFLDSYNVPGVGIVNNADPTTGNYVSANETATFNDKLIYVTATDLMRKVEQTVLNRIARQLRTDVLSSTVFNGTYPVNTAALLTFAPYSTATNPLYFNWLNTANTGNTYDAAVDGTTPGYLPSVTYTSSNAANLVCNNGTNFRAVVRGINVTGFPQQCAGAL